MGLGSVVVAAAVTAAGVPWRGVGDTLENAVGLALAYFVGGAFVWWRRRRSGVPFAALINGLNRADRRAAWQRIRAGTPSENPVVREIEHQSAERIVDAGTTRQVCALAVVVAAAATAGIVLGDLEHQVVSVVAAVAVAFALLHLLRSRPGARRYLAAVAE